MRSATERVERLLAAVVPAAASLAERREAPWLEPAPGCDGDGDAAALWRAWADAAAGGDPGALSALLDERGLDVEACRTSLRTMRAVPGAELPAWAGALRKLLVASMRVPAPEDVALAASLTAGGSFTVTAESSIPVAEGLGAQALAGFAATARSYVGSTGPPALADELARHLLARMLLVCLPAFRGGAPEAFAPERAPFDGWASMLERCPALGRVLGTVAVQGQLFSRELLGRLAADRAELEPVLAAAGRAPLGGAPDTGDRHDEGRFVLPVGFEDGRVLLYKPKDLRAAGVLARIVEVLGGGQTLPARLERGAYVWEAFVERRLPATAAGWSDLAYDVGAWTCVFELLGATDMIGSNVLVHGSRLVPVDAETLLRFLFVPASGLPWAPPGTSSRLLSAPMVSRNQTLLGDVGLLADPGHRPLLEHLDRTLAGYAEMQARIVRSRPAIAALLDELAPLPLRAVVRNTWVYFRLLMSSLAPAALASGAARDVVLERLWRAQRRFGLPTALVEAEVESLRDLDVPLFRFLAGGRDLLGPGGRVAASALSEAPLDAVRARLGALEPEVDAAELDAIAAQFFCADANRRGQSPPESAVASAERNGFGVDGDEVDWTAAAVGAGDELLELLAGGGPGGTRLEAGTVFDAGSSLLSLSAVRPADLLSGSLGVAVALADLAAASGEERFAAEAGHQREHALRALHAAAEDVERWNRSRADPPPGGLHWGLPAVLYTLFRLPAAGDEDGLARAGEALARFDVEEAYRLGSWLRGTMPAALLTATSVDAGRAEPGVRAFLAATDGLRGRLGSLLAAGWERLWPESQPNPALAALFPSEQGLAALALARHARSLGRPLPVPAAAWAKGIAGPRRDGCPAVDRLIAVDLAAPAVVASGRLALPETSLGCLDVVEERLASVRRGGVAAGSPAATLQTARAAGAAILVNRRRSGRWFPEAAAPDRFRLSALWGLGAVVRAFVGLAEPQRWYSLRLLEQPGAEGERPGRLREPPG